MGALKDAILRLKDETTLSKGHKRLIEHFDAADEEDADALADHIDDMKKRLAESTKKGK